MTDTTTTTDTGVTSAADASLAMPQIETAKAPHEVTEADLEQEFGQNERPAPEGGDDAHAAEGSADGENGDTGEQPGKPKSDVQARFDEMTAGRREAERREAEARRDAEYWRGQVEKAAPAPKEPGQVDPAAEPQPDNYEFGEADAKFIADTARFAARQEFAAQQQQAEVRAGFASMEAGWQANTGKVVERYPDFQSKVVESADRGEWDCSPLMAIGIKSSSQGPDVAYHLATNPAEAKRIARLSNIEQAREFGRLEARFELKHGGQTQSKQPATTSAPPPPAGQARGSGGRFSVAGDTNDFSSFERSADAILTKK